MAIKYGGGPLVGVVRWWVPELGLVSLFSSQLLSFLPWRVVVLPAESAEPSATIEQLRSQDLDLNYFLCHLTSSSSLSLATKVVTL